MTARRIVVPISSREDIPAGSIVRITEPDDGRHCIFKGQGFHIPGDIADHFDIENILIGEESQLSFAHPIPGEAFSTKVCSRCHCELLPGSGLLDMRTAKVGEKVSVVLFNRSDVSQLFRAAFVGVTADISDVPRSCPACNTPTPTPGEYCGPCWSARAKAL